MDNFPSGAQVEAGKEVPNHLERRDEMRSYRRWTLEQKRDAVQRMAICKHERLAQEMGIPKRQLYSWRKDLQRLQKIAAERGSSNERMLRNENRRLKEALASKVMEADFLQGVLRSIEARRQPSSGSGETASIERSR